MESFRARYRLPLRDPGPRGRHRRHRTGGRATVTAITLLAIALGVAAIGYLVVALIFPERF
nr:potassium-transporting ATPase subunit F [Galbitalea soli]